MRTALDALQVTVADFKRSAADLNIPLAVIEDQK